MQGGASLRCRRMKDKREKGRKERKQEWGPTQNKSQMKDKAKASKVRQESSKVAGSEMSDE